MQAHQSKHSIGGSTIRERERDVCVLFEFRQFFLLWELVYKIKDKDKEALFNVAYNVTDNISS